MLSRRPPGVDDVRPLCPTQALDRGVHDGLLGRTSFRFPRQLCRYCAQQHAPAMLAVVPPFYGARSWPKCTPLKWLFSWVLPPPPRFGRFRDGQVKSETPQIIPPEERCYGEIHPGSDLSARYSNLYLATFTDDTPLRNSPQFLRRRNTAYLPVPVVCSQAVQHRLPRRVPLLHGAPAPAPALL